ncbi:sorbitol ABC transporter ATP-binding protein/mannitol ABC transporter ATP-binding protein [Cohaesibacter marisflavi]|uniref:Sorbitol ABC transporter ATP-binding protein/mannitol ABC transporter ATP-binding protein n=1 Tax=Cohaesibacter marisflavi TaxID=655353 RepID=A0A1I5JTL2_9HYPH|nr:ABC transporter ATP-binding protein [Cohaesibacter marisflavi]SFO76040.1 sorbitol ABC transporter ATP-binding protein/mannitol ABC transporter ATP-binding protein [Cohaesibacter marisflavi]
MGRIVLENVTKKFGDLEVIPPLNLTIEDGEFVVFVGPSGCGKSTLLRLIAGLEEVTSGRILIDGEDVTNIPPSKRGLAMVFQTYALYPHMSVRKNIAFPLRMAGMNEAEQNTRIEAAATALNLTDYLDRKPGQLSGGQRQRVAIGRAIVRDPTAFLFDEPLSNLDAALRVGMRLEISEMHKKLKTTMIYVTHDQVEAMTMADKIVVLQSGRVEQVGSPLDLYREPRNAFVAGFIGSPKMNFIDGEKAGTLGAHTIGVRPEHVQICPKGEGDVWQGKVGVAEHLGSDTFIHVHGIDGCDPMTVRAGGEVKINHGDTVYLSAQMDQIHKFDSEGHRVS